LHFSLTNLKLMTMILQSLVRLPLILHVGRQAHSTCVAMAAASSDDTETRRPAQDVR